MENIITKTGDKGSTKDFLGNSFSKADDVMLVLAYGDMVNAQLGNCRYLNDGLFKELQEVMWGIMGNISATLSSGSPESLDKNWDCRPSKFDKANIDKLEKLSADIRLELKEVKLGGWMHYSGLPVEVACKWVRIWECFLNQYVQGRFPAQFIPDGFFEDELVFVNRLSDYLFYLAIKEKTNG